MVTTLERTHAMGRPEHASGRPGFLLQDVGFRIGAQPLLRNVDLELEPGRLYGLIGHNGSGKTTLLKLLARQEPPSEGRIDFAGQPLDGWSQRAFAREVAYLAQRLPEATGLTVRELTALGRYPWHGSLGRFGAEDRAHVDGALEQTGMRELADRFVDTLSGGERQRAWLAMLVAQHSRCMLLDEPISALDVAHQLEVMELVRDLCRARGLTVVVVLHDINMAARFCDVLVALHSGRKIASGPPSEVATPEVLQRIYGVPMGVLGHPEREARICYVV